MPISPMLQKVQVLLRPLRASSIDDDDDRRPRDVPSAALLPPGTDLRTLSILPDDRNHNNCNDPDHSDDFDDHYDFPIPTRT